METASSLTQPFLCRWQNHALKGARKQGTQLETVPQSRTLGLLGTKQWEDPGQALTPPIQDSWGQSSPVARPVRSGALTPYQDPREGVLPVN